MIEMDDLERAVAVPRRGQIEFEIERFVRVSGAFAFAFARLFIIRAAVDGDSKSLVAGGDHAAFFTLAQQSCVD